MISKALLKAFFTKHIPPHYKPNVRVNTQDIKITRSGEVVKNEK